MKIQYKDPSTIVFESALFRTTSTVVETEDLLLLVDPNWLPIEIATIQQEVQKRLKGKPLFILFTHSDYDHIIGYNAFPNAQVIASQAFEDNPNKASILTQIKDWDDENYINRTYEITYPTIDFVVKEDGQQLKIGRTILTFYLAFGHNTDGIFTIIEPLGIWIAGDYLSNIEFPYIYHSSLEYENTLAKVVGIIERHTIRMLITGHGDIAYTEGEILKRKKEAIAYIHALRTALKSGVDFDFEELMKGYDFPKIMKQFHDGNVVLMKKEMLKGT